MTSFEELGVNPELVEALAAEGVEVPSSFQESAIPVLLRGNSLIGQAGPGAGTLIAYGVPLLQTVDPEASSPRALVLTPSPIGALRLAQSLSRLAQVTGHRVAALGSSFALPELASVLFASPEDLLARLRSSRVALGELRALVVDGYGALLPQEKKALDTVMEAVPRDCQKVLVGQPLPAEANEFAKAHLHKAVHVPPRSAEGVGEKAPPKRGAVAYRVCGETKEMELLQTVADVLEGGSHHVLLFFHSEDQAADAGDFLGIHGYLAGAPGDPEVPVWLGVEELEGRRVVEEWMGEGTITTISVDTPMGPDSLDRRHGGQEGGIILVRSREIPHLRALAGTAGYTLAPVREPVPTRVAGELERLQDLLARAIKEQELAPHFLVIEPLFQHHAPAEVAAAAVALLRKRGEGGKPDGAGKPARVQEPRTDKGAPRTWVRLFVGVGEKEGIGPGDLLGAIAGEAGVEGSQVGKIEIRETFSLVEVLSQVADRVIKGLNGTTIRGRSVRCDYDRGGPTGRGRGGSRGGRPPGRGGASPRER